MTLAFVIAIFAALRPGADHEASRAVVDAIVQEAATPEEAALLATYALHESAAQETPVPTSWDARAGVSCGPWQLRCALVRGATVRYQAHLWLWLFRRYGLVSLDSLKARAEKRHSEALKALQAVQQAERSTP
jgi:hypothetical protein